MFYQLLPRMSMELNETLKSQSISGEGVAMVTIGISVYNFGGTSPTVDVLLQSSDDGELWSDIGSAIQASTAGVTFGNIVATTNAFGRLLRVGVALGGTNSIAEFAVGVSTRMST